MELETWRQAVVVIDGKQIPVGPDTILHVQGDDYAVSVNGRVIQRGTSIKNYETNPWESDVTISEGDQAGQQLSQIFLIDGDVLIACAAVGESPRPTEFTSRPGTGHILSIWLRDDIVPPPAGWKLVPFL